ncbi:MAG: FlgD immunoglobulin-like domain containing protein [Bacteroidota bacterium]
MTTAAAVNNAANNTAAATSKSAASGKSLAQNFDTFLTMLTTQLKHQDPLSPMDSTQFTNQLVQFAGVEQQINANSNLEKLISATSMNTGAQAVNYIGRAVEADTNQVPLQGSVDTQSNTIQLANGKATFKYALSETSTSTLLRIKDSTGAVVRTLSGDVTKGIHEITWDGEDSAGTAMAAGSYTVEPVVTNSKGDKVATTTYTSTRTGNAAFSYTLAKDAKTCSVVIKDSTGTIVRTLPGDLTKGRHEVKWDGKDKSGNDLPDGNYTATIAALDGGGETIDSAVTVYGKVTDVASDDTGTLIGMGQVVVPMTKILTVRDSASLLLGSDATTTTK